MSTVVAAQYRAIEPATAAERQRMGRESYPARLCENMTGIRVPCCSAASDSLRAKIEAHKLENILRPAL